MEASKRQMIKGLMAAPALAVPAFTLTSPTNAATPTNQQVPGVYRFWVGEIEVTALLDGYGIGPTAYIPEYDAAKAKAANQASYKPFDPNQIKFPVNGYVVNTGKNVVLIDAGGPSFAIPGLGHLSAQLELAGFKPSDIDTLLFTHLHIDHIGALRDAEGKKAYPDAVFRCSEAEWKFVFDENFYNAVPEDFKKIIQAERSIVSSYENQREMFSGEKEIVSGITSVPLPGHTPGHTGYSISSGDSSLLIWGDVVHFSGLQFAIPDWSVVFDTDATAAKATRRKMLDQASSDRMMVAGMHIDFPGVGYVERTKKAYRYVQAPWQSSK